MADAAPEILGFREFAQRYGWKASYVTQLKDAERLVLTPDRRKVRVAESLALIEATRDPSKAGVAARHATTRTATNPSASTPQGAGQGGDSGAEAPDAPPVDFVPNDPHSKRRAKAMADKEEALARKALRDEQVELGNLLQREDVLAMNAAAAVTFRTALENLSATLAPQLAAIEDEARCKVLLDTSFEHALEELSRKFAAIGGAGAV